MKKHLQKGFSAVEGLLTIIALALVVFVGYYVWHTQKQTDKTLNTALQTSQNTVNKSSPALQKLSLASGSVTLNVPTGWDTVTAPTVAPATTACRYSAFESSSVVCQDAKLVMPSSFNKDPNSPFSAYVSVYSTTNADPQSWFNDDFGGGSPDSSDANDTVSTAKISGYSALYWEQKVSDSNGKYQDEHYILYSSGKIVYVYSRVLNNDSDYNKYLPNIKAIANSVKIQ